MSDEANTPERLEQLLRSHGLHKETMLFRATLQEFLSETSDPDVFLLSANVDSGEGIIDEYGGGHSTVATHVGPGLAFTESRDNQWLAEGRIGVSVRLGDVLDQGGLLYPVESVITETVWYLTLPSGSVRVRRV